MTTTILTQEQTKNLLREVLIELLEERKSEFHKLIIEAIEEVALANAIRAGRKNEFVSEDEIQTVLDQNRRGGCLRLQRLSSMALGNPGILGKQDLTYR